MGRGKTVSAEIRELIIRLYVDEIRQTKIARTIGLNKSIVSRIIKRYKQTKNVTPMKNPGRPRKTSSRLDRHIVNMVKQVPFLSSSKIVADLKETEDPNISARTVRRRLVEANLLSRHPARKPLLSKKNVTARLAFAKAHLHWTLGDWKKVVFSDESKFNLFTSDGIQYVRRPPSQRLNPKYIIPTVKHGGGSLMVWGCFSGFKMGPLHRIHGIMNQYVYKNILANVLTPYTDENMPITFIFQHDNDPKHTSRTVKQWIIQETLKVLPWPSQSPDLNPIENLWSILHAKVRERNYRNLDELFMALENAWENIDNTTVFKLLESMPKRCAAVIAAKGYHTKY